MNRLRIDSDTIANPNLFGLADLKFGMTIQEGELNLKLARQPKIVGIKKGHITTRGVTDAEITRRGDAPVHGFEPSQSAVESCQSFCRAVRRTVIDDDELEVSKGLREHRVDGFGDERPPVIGRNNDAD